MFLNILTQMSCFSAGPVLIISTSWCCAVSANTGIINISIMKVCCWMYVLVIPWVTIIIDLELHVRFTCYTPEQHTTLILNRKVPCTLFDKVGAQHINWFVISRV